MKLKISNTGAGILSVFTLAIIGICIFLFSKDDAGLTGIQTLRLESTAFWVCAVICFILSVVFIVLGIRSNNTTGGSGKTVALFIIAAALLFGPFGKGCTDKANKGVTAPNYKSK